MKPNTQVSGLNRINQRLGALRERMQKNSGVYVGIPSGAGSYEDGAPLAVIGAVHEFGSADGHIPERSFLRVPLRSNQDLFAKIFVNELPRVVNGELTMLQLMNEVGARAAGESQEAISSGIMPPNAPSTIRQKGSSTPLIGKNGRLWQSITWVVQEGEGG